MRLGATCLLIAATCLTGTFAGAQSIPTPEQFTKWDANFGPGLYEFVDFELSSTGEAKQESAKTRQECLDRMKTYFLGRGTMFSGPMEDCTILNVKLDSHGLSIAHHCGTQQPNNRPLIGAIVIEEIEQGAFLATVMKQVYVGRNTSQEPVSGVGHMFRRVGPCK